MPIPLHKRQYHGKRQDKGKIKQVLLAVAQSWSTKLEPPFELCFWVFSDCSTCNQMEDGQDIYHDKMTFFVMKCHQISSYVMKRRSIYHGDI